MKRPMQHLDMRPVDPPGHLPRRWKCLDCGLVRNDLQELVDDLTCTGPLKDQNTRLMDAIEEKQK